ncbi:hypothetical protein ACLVWU_09780 [Bdellovibrio sp. HCB290]|uniref:hypothetical protein n=1 Tax=Bdellovibrio sp. HCB290 TaxID=3394356 RepID=UPI0039B4EA87
MKWFLSLTVLLLLGSLQVFATTVRIGNGGDTNSGSEVSFIQLSKVIDDYKRDIPLLISSWTNLKFGAPLSQNELADLLTVVQKVPVQVLLQKPCFDGTTDKDAVAFQNPPQICISTFQLQNKLTTANYKNQIVSLLVHEFSHLIGFDENRAVQLQQFTLQYIGTYGYPEVFSRGDVDDFTLLDPYSIFEGLWTNKNRLAAEVKIYSNALKVKMQAYADYSRGPYPALPADKNYTGDIMVRLNYLSLVSKAYWQRFPSAETQEQLEVFFKGYQGIDISYFNNSELNTAPLILNSGKNGLTAIDRKTSESVFKAIILEIDSLKQAMEVQLWTTLKQNGT